ncbi:hypothetical protein MKZ38_001923 [Zalerion maritima]|uniref:BTB domain-containing protein n=1 Tax=Zalerion maritima TaxID=339359 RepID=A0AAD5RPQ9_9PEZI|nr:hypothetical protein MKZ38_001923 [Zalerion maritima]
MDDGMQPSIPTGPSLLTAGTAAATASTSRTPKLREKTLLPNLAITNQRFYNHDLRLLEEGYLSDVKVSCGNETWDLHKIILCSRCLWFEKAFAAGFAAGCQMRHLSGWETSALLTLTRVNIQESQSGHVTIQEFEPEKVYWMIRYIYTGVINIKELRTDSTVYAACLDLYILGDYFDMPELRSESLACLTAHCNSKAGDLQQRQPQGEALKQIMDLEALFEGLKLAFGDNADEGNPVAQILLNLVHKTRFCLLPNPKFLELLGQVPKFSVALMKVLYGQQYDLRGVRYPSKCADCGVSPGQGKHFDKMYPFTHQSWESRAYCSECAPDAEEIPTNIFRAAKRRTPYAGFNPGDW